MPEGENKEDLFEDLDKFFAPIQDVDWPESAGIPSAQEPAEREEVAEPAEEVEERPADEPHEEPPPDRLLFGPEQDEADISVESFSQPPSAYVDLPGGEEEDQEVSAELEEGPEEEPSPEAIEAAADHFAESVRDEVRVDEEPEPVIAESVSDLLGTDTGSDELPTMVEEPSGGRTVRVGTEGFGGPSWQEPTTMEVGATDHEARPTGRDMPAAFLTGLVLAALAIGSIAIAAGAFAIVAGAIALWAQGELYRALQKHHLQPATALGLVSGALILGAGYFRGEAAMLSMFVLSVFAAFLWYMATPPAHRRGTLANVGVTVLGIAYVPLLAGFALAMLDLEDGPALVVSVVALTFVYDTAAFIIGSWWGSRPLAPTISPRKSLEGAVGATLVVIAVSVGAVAASVEVFEPVSHSVGLALVVAVFAPLGDLAESLLKRDLGFKDMGSVLPGHGGVLDRIDSVLFVAPAAFLFLRLIQA